MVAVKLGASEPQVAAATRAPLIALLGNPNCGKTALFNRLTGARQKVANYAGVTIERKEGSFISPAGRAYKVLDLPGAYSLSATTPDEAITRDVVAGLRAGDVITAINDQPLPVNTTLTNILTKFAIGDRLTLTLLRAGQVVQLPVTLTDRP